MKKILIIGGGAAGMFAAIAAAEAGNEVHLYEKNERLGKKLYITGKGRCNLTNACDMEGLFEGVCTNRKFLYSAFYGCTNTDVIDFFEAHGCPTKTERGQRVFPVSDKSTDVIDVLRNEMKARGVHIHLNCGVAEVLTAEEKSENKDGNVKRAAGLRLLDGRMEKGDAVIVATGGLSYQSTGSTGDGYRFAEECGHTVTPRYPSLVPFNVKENFAKEMQGLSLRNVTLSVYDGKKRLFEEFGEMMFTHFGVTGPLVLTASTAVQKKLREKSLSLVIDLKPALSKEQLDARLLREFEEGRNKQFKNVIGNFFPAKMTPVMISLSGIAPDKKVNEITREERNTLVQLMKHLELTATGLRDYNEAIITRGGVAVKEIDPATMESKLVKGLYFAGEVLDLDAVTGGFNLQIAWSTGYAAGHGAAQSQCERK
ncbi:MAG: NAD(P)/FAD-dependent oxidoreductase [Eubacteriales bacterium]|nr:NAD(P)/FAD-dependent oxidoreductase [Eubacteriales bacterium]